MEHTSTCIADMVIHDFMLFLSRILRVVPGKHSNWMRYKKKCQDISSTH